MTRPIHFEILADDPTAAAEFYRTIFGWEITEWEGPQKYWLIKTGEEDDPGIDGGIMHRHLAQSVINTHQVESLDAMIEKIEEAGGKLAYGPNEIPGVGMHAYCADPEGNLFGLLQPSPPLIVP